MSFKASGRAAFSAAAQAAYIATASVAAPAGIPTPDARSLTQDIPRPLPPRIITVIRRSWEGSWVIHRSGVLGSATPTGAHLLAFGMMMSREEV